MQGLLQTVGGSDAERPAEPGVRSIAGRHHLHHDARPPGQFRHADKRIVHHLRRADEAVQHYLVQQQHHIGRIRPVQDGLPLKPRCYQCVDGVV